MTGVRTAILFDQPGFAIDTRLIVFDFEFHVNSTILRLYSQFFRKFLDRYDATRDPSNAKSSFLYEYILKGDGDGVYGLQPLRSTTSTGPTEASYLISSIIIEMLGQTSDEDPSETIATPFDELKETRSLEQLMNAFYMKSSTLQNLGELEKLVQTADFYGALPIVSTFVEANLHNSKELCTSMGDGHISDVVKTLCLARKLKAATLFREAFIYVISCCEDEEGYEEVMDELTSQDNEDLIPLVNLYYARLCRKITEAHFFIIKCCMDHQYVLRQQDSTIQEKQTAIISEVIRNGIQPIIGEDSPKFSAEFFNNVCRAPFTPTSEQALRYGEVTQSEDGVAVLSRRLQKETVKHVKKALWPVLRDETQFCINGAEYETSSKYDIFVCTVLHERDLPWLSGSAAS
ncbi:hypothetical protein AJ79_05977 [Helicocarpus griseus UAMH5409]|uniref:BTB domain-containing protein n=1 Tax=Helicocarpus griseus UAMH5409 TaxID=1447875 RepID=A0A2B7XIP4_9EURO|nr:hypothetical protein AJ79_05977 [Helicocarpus griseus UAMH5409]